LSPMRPSPPPRIVLALEDTFRISGSNPNDPRTSLPYVRWRASRLRDRDSADEDVEGIVVIPPLGDVMVENEVRQLFGRHGIRTQDSESVESPSQSQSGLGYEAEAVYDAAAEDEHERQRDRDRDRENMDPESMEVDELESDCISSHTPSRSSSPSPSTHIPLQVSSSSLRVAARHLLLGRQRRTVIRKDDLDLAGMCFDPSGGFIYVASVNGVAEWGVRGAEKRWWFDSKWA
jgi:hypothetical protein